MEASLKCKNCEQEFSSDFDYCPHCGQKSNDQLTIQVLFSNTISNYFSVDARFFKSVFPLLFKPGVLARRFVDGKRQVYLHPAQYYLFISVIFFFLFSIVTRDHDQIFEEGAGNVQVGDSVSVKEQLDEMELSEAQRQKIDSLVQGNYQQKEYNFTDRKMDSLIAAGASDEEKMKHLGFNGSGGKLERFVYQQSLKIYESRAGGLVSSFYDTIPISMFFLLPVFALILKLFYRKSGQFSHHIVFSFYYFTFVFLSMSLLIVIGFWVDIPGGLIALYIFLVFVYLVVGSVNFYQQKWVKVFFKSVLVVMTYAFIVTPISFFIMVLITFALY